MCSLRLRLGAPLPFDGGTCEQCRVALDAFGYHRLVCHLTVRIHVRHRILNQAWRQVFIEAGGVVPRRNVERFLRDTPVVVPADDTRRIDLVVPCSGVARGVPLLCDVTCVAPVTRAGRARDGCLTIDGGAVVAATSRCNRDYSEVGPSGVARLCCLGVEVLGRWSTDSLWVVPALARERTRHLPHRVRVKSVPGAQSLLSFRMGRNPNTFGKMLKGN